MLKKIKMFFKILFQCKIMGAHNWTSAAMENKEPTPEQLARDVAGFYDYAKMYCKDCKQESELNDRFKH